MELWAGILFGFAGSFHCLGMCGPIALALPHKKPGTLSVLFGNLLYNLGRAVTYTLLGLIVGAAGASFKLAGYQEALSIVLGSLILIAVLLPGKIKKSVTKISFIRNFYENLKNVLRNLMNSKTTGSLFIFGLLNGLLPCGFVYMALAPAMAYGDVWGSAMFMAGFGLGTFPIMSAVYVSRKFVSIRLRTFINKAVPYGLAIVALLLILRGMSLGVPYISPKLPDSVKNKPACCSEEE